MSYWRDQLWKIDLSLSLYYSLGRAYQTSLRNRPQLAKGTGGFLTYGETPFTTFQTICTWLQPSSAPKFAELGCGTGRLSLFAAKQWKWNVTAIDLIGPFVSNGNKIASRYNLSCSFKQADIRDVDWSDFDILYLTSTTYSEDLLLDIWNKCTTLKSGAQLITLTHSPPKEQFQIIHMDVLPFSWGVATVYLSSKI